MNALENSIYNLFDVRNASRHGVGISGEMAIRLALMSVGYKVFPTGKRKCGDLAVTISEGNTVTIDVKTAQQSADGNYRFSLTRQEKNGKKKTCHMDSHFVALVAVTKSRRVAVFLIPSLMLSEQSNICLSANSLFSGGKYDAYRQDVNSLSLVKSVDAATGE
jgi:hypothetical protein